jgi:HPt (histidine-containing phosphotransfer) domain-containing protein
MPVNPSNLIPLENLSSVPVLDQEALEQFRKIDGGGLGLTKEMFEIFETDMPPRLSALNEAIESNALSRVAELSHAIKGSCGTIGAMRVRYISAWIEAYGRGYEVEAAPSRLFEQLQDECNEVFKAFGKYISENQ